MDFYSGEDTHLKEKLANLANSDEPIGAETQLGFQVIWSKANILDFTSWSENTYSNWSNEQKKDALYGRGVILHCIEGRGDFTKATVTVTNHTWYYLLLRGEYRRRSEITEAYLDDLFTLRGYLELGGVGIAAILTEFAEKYANLYGGTTKAARKKLERIRIPLNKYGYVLNGKDSDYKQIRVKVRGENSWLQGPRAVFLHGALTNEFGEFYENLYKKFPNRKEDSDYIKAKVNLLRAEKTDDFVNSLLKKHNLSMIRSHRMSCLANKARIDYDAIKTLYMNGASFSEIRSFLSVREEFWKMRLEEEREGNKDPRSHEEIIDEIF